MFFDRFFMQDFFCPYFFKKIKKFFCANKKSIFFRRTDTHLAIFISLSAMYLQYKIHYNEFNPIKEKEKSL